MLFEASADALDLLGRAVSRAHKLARGTALLKVTLDAQFATKWLMRRVDEFRRHQPGIELRFDITYEVRDFDRDDVDIGIRFGTGKYPGLCADRLFDNVTALSAPGSRLATEHMDLQTLPEDWAEKLAARTRRIGSDINLAELFYAGERHSAGDYLASHGWRVSVRSTLDAFAANGFELPDDELATFAGQSGYLAAVFG